MNFPNKLTVKYHGETVGTLAMAREKSVCVFEYSPQWLKDGFSISPIELPLRPGLFVADENPFFGNFGIFADSLPDGYGMFLVHRILKRRGMDYLNLSPLHRLGLVGNSGMGALYYEPATTIDDETPAIPDFDAMQQLAIDVLSERHYFHAQGNKIEVFELNIYYED